MARLRHKRERTLLFGWVHIEWREEEGAFTEKYTRPAFMQGSQPHGHMLLAEATQIPRWC